MTSRTKKTYSKEFRIEALNLAKELGSYADAARKLGIKVGVLYSWKNKYNFSIEPMGKPAEATISATEELHRLRKENEELKKVNYILKRAAAFFSQDHLK